QVRPARGIDPYGGAREPEVTDGIRRKERRGRRGEAARHVPAEGAAAVALDRPCPHERDRLGLEHTLAVEAAAVQEHAADPREIGGRRKHSGVPRHAAQGPAAPALAPPAPKLPLPPPRP